ncbi:MAG TPA: hypothetical protein VHE30_03705 [Polyangiaceae bacterium]|nr:hypothetical protein [Polyangiaceae bacterium]
MALTPAFPWSQPRSAEPRPVAGRPAPRMASAAVRIPDPRMVQVPLQFVSGGPQIFVHEGARQALERKLELAYPGPVQLAVTDNRQRMITQTRERGVLRVRVHMMFLDAPERVQDALVEYVIAGGRDASQVVGAFIEGNSHRIRASRHVRGPLRTKGKVHDLRDLLGRVNATYFGGSVNDVLITWGRRTRAAESRRTIKLGSYSAEERLIRIHPVLDKPWVPRYFVSYIVYHELVHHVVPPVRSGGLTSVHPPEFLRREREFRHYDRAIAWEEAHIGRLLRA